MSTQHTCRKCLSVKDISSFYIRDNGKPRNECKACLAIIRESKKEHIAKLKKQWQLLNKEYLRQYDKLHYIKNKASRNAKNNKYTVERMRIDLNFKLRKRLRSRLSNLINARTRGGSSIEDLGCSISELICHLESLFKPGMTWNNYGEWEIDHVQPLCKFDLTDKQQFLIACNYKNLQPLWKSEHLLKTIEDRRHGKNFRNT